MAGVELNPQPVRAKNVQERAKTVWTQDSLRLAFENSPDANLIIDDGVFVDCNQAAVQMLRYQSKDDLLSLSPSDLSPELQPDGSSSSSKVKQMIAVALEKGSHRFEWLARRSDQSEFPVEVLLTAIPVEDRQILHTVWRDITRRKQAEQELSKFSEALLGQTEVLTSILDHMSDAVIVADKDYKFLTFNPAAERMFGSGATETKAEGWSRTYGLYLPDQQTPFPADELPLARSIRGEVVDDLEMFVRHEKSPEGVWVRVSGRPLRNAAGELSGGVVVCHDISESKKEDAFRAGQSRVLEMIARGEPLAEVLSSLVVLIEAQAPGMLCSVLMLGEDGTHVVHGAAPSLPASYIQAVNGAPIGPKNGSCGTAMYLGKQVIVTDIMNDVLWEDYRPLAEMAGLRACWSTPILSGSGKVLGSFAMYYREPQAPTGTEARLTEVATHIAGIAIEHQRAENELRASEERFAKAFNANPHPMSLATLDEGRIIEVNESFVELSGYARPELIGRTSLEFLWEMPLARSELLQQLKERGVVRNLEARIRTRSGLSRVVLLSSLVVEIGGQSCILSVANDITERRRAEEQVSLLQAITTEVSVAPDLVSALGVVLRRVCETTGWILGQSWIPRADKTALECSPAFYAATDGLEEFRLGSVNARLPPGVGLPGRVWLSQHAVWVKDVTTDGNFPRGVLAEETGLKAALAIPIIADGEVMAVIEFFMPEPQSEDERLVKVITAVATQLDLVIERKRAEDQLRNTEAELAHVARITTMGELAASIAHEVNQPLGAIVGNADICRQWLGSTEPDLAQLREALDDIASDGRRASQIITRIRSLMKKHAPEKVPLDLSDVAREVLDLVGHEAQRKQVTLVPELGTALPAVAADRVQLQQVLLNLVMNGIEAMSAIAERKPELRLKTDRFADGVMAVVSDCGMGIDPNQAEQIFKPFHTTKSSGMGMGLAISRSIIEAHGGKLWAEPNKQAGATFKFTLPAVTDIEP
ncbi:MAG TPA: PAS domain S-box protein [Pyrinomonadaceae bacterium]|nr:PAS domain S-box protein [Pyrinomonadaceae bacterium]